MTEENRIQNKVQQFLDDKSLSEIANQLRCPSGEAGLAMGEVLNATNTNMIGESIESLELENENRVLELGHGSCAHLSNLLSKAKNLKYFGMEISEVMKTEAERINSRHINKRRALFQTYDGLNVPYVANFFDRIITVNTLYFLEDVSVFLNEMYRVLKPGGVFVLTIANGSFMKNLPFVVSTNVFNLYDYEDIKELVDKTDFELRSTKQYKEKVLSKTGDLVEKAYFVTVLTKKIEIIEI